MAEEQASENERKLAEARASVMGEEKKRLPSGIHIP